MCASKGSARVKFTEVAWDPVITYVSRLRTNRIPADTGNRVIASVNQNGSKLFSVNLGRMGRPAAHDLSVRVSRGDRICFTTACGPGAAGLDTGLVNDDSSLLTYSGSWTYDKKTPGYFKEDQHFSSSAGDYAEFKFIGTGIQWIGPRNIDCGVGNVYLDGVQVESVNLYAPSWEKQQVLYENRSLPDAPHTIKIVVAPQKNPPGAGGWVPIDAFVYDPRSPQ